MSAVTPEARQQAANRVAYAIRTQAPWSGSDDIAQVVVGQMIADGWSPPVTPEAGVTRAQIDAAVSYPLRHSDIADFRYECMLDNLEELFARKVGSHD